MGLRLVEAGVITTSQLEDALKEQGSRADTTRLGNILVQLGFGFRRLSIIDLEGGHQPMSDQDEAVWVVFNGEIYNFPELRRELEAFVVSDEAKRSRVHVTLTALRFASCRRDRTD